MKQVAAIALTILGILLGTPTTLSAQTDVTDQYLTNAGFDNASDFVGSTVCTYAKDGDVYSCQPVTGWTADATGEAKAGGVFGFGLGHGLSGNGYVLPATNSDGNSTGGALGLAGCWSNSVGYSQPVSLPKGLYRISFKVYNAGKNIIANYASTMGFVSSDGTEHYADVDFYGDEWTEVVVYLNLHSPTSGKIHLGYKCANVGSAASPKLFVDYVRIEQMPDEYMLEDLTGSIDKGGWGGTGGYTAEGIAGREVFQEAASLATGRRLGQQLTGLPDGSYSLTMLVSVSSTSERDNTSNVITDGSTAYASLHANAQQHGVPAYNRVECGKYDRITLNDIAVTDGTLDIWLNQDQTGPNWLVLQVQSLKCVRPIPPELRYTIGDVNEDGAITLADVSALVSILLGQTAEYKDHLADVNKDKTVSIADVTALVNIILGKAEAETVDQTWKYADLDAMIYAQQSATENAAGPGYTLNKAVSSLTGDDVSAHYDMADHLTTLRITTSLADVASVSVYALGKEAIAGPMTVSSKADDVAYTYTAGPELTYANSQESDVVTVSNAASGTTTVYLRPVSLAQGVKVTVRTTDGHFYSQDFTTIAAGQENTLAFNATTAQNLWMATLPGNTYFSMLSTPGAHDAATSGCTDYTYLSKCQADNLQTLLANGVRAFDVRPGYFYTSTITESNLYIYHGQVSTNVLYKDAIRIFAEFLEANPTEAISIIMVKENNKPTLSFSSTDRSSEMWSIINAVHTTYGNYMKLLDHSYYTLDDFRGKICYVNRTGTDCTNTVRITNWPDDASVTDYSCAIGGTCYASVEDAYNANETNKKTAVTQLLNLASANTNRARFHYTYTSIAGSLTSNLTGHAAVMNPYTADYISKSITGPAGYVYGDYMGSQSYGGATLLHAIINQNYKYVFTGRTRVE